MQRTLKVADIDALKYLVNKIKDTFSPKGHNHNLSDLEGNIPAEKIEGNIPAEKIEGGLSLENMTGVLPVDKGGTGVSYKLADCVICSGMYEGRKNDLLTFEFPGGFYPCYVCITRYGDGYNKPINPLIFIPNTEEQKIESMVSINSSGSVIGCIHALYHKMSVTEQSTLLKIYFNSSEYDAEYESDAELKQMLYTWFNMSGYQYYYFIIGTYNQGVVGPHDILDVGVTYGGTY